MKYITLAIIGLAIMSSCAVGSAVSAYSLQSRSADSLTAEAEFALIEKMKVELEK